MKLSNAARFFDRLPLYEGYNGIGVGYGQLKLYPDNTRDSVTSQRRILSIADDVRIPTSKVIQNPKFGRFIVGELHHDDSWQGSVIRRRYALHQAIALAHVQTPEAYLADTVQDQHYAGMTWVKNLRDMEETSLEYPVYQIIFSDQVMVTEGSIISVDNKVLRARVGHCTDQGFSMVYVDDITGSKQPATFHDDSTYSMANDEFTAGVVNVDCIFYRERVDYDYRSELADPGVLGMRACIVSQADVPSVTSGGKVTIDSIDYRIRSVRPEFQCWRLGLQP